MESARRLFVGLRPPIETAEILHARARSTLAAARARDLRLVAAPDVHLTLCFLGNVLEEGELALRRELAHALTDARPCDLVVTATGAFPSPGHERVLWAGIEEALGARGRFEPLRHAVVRAARAAGLQPDRQSLAAEFTPHLTLARIRGRLEVPGEFYALRFAIPWPVGEVHLFESALAPGALVRYPVRETYRLEAQPGERR